MELLHIFSFDMLAMSLISCLVLREVFVVALPDSVAGPGGWLVNTEERD
ncbi:MAG: hypothetical protein AAGA71_04525 [Pseudomonadota bacterium]